MKKASKLRYGAENSGNGQSHLSRIGGRLWRSRWNIAAVCVVLLALNGVVEVSIFAVLAGILFVAAVTALAPQDRAAQPRAADPADHRSGSGLSASDLAAAVSDPIIVIDDQGVVTETNAAARNAFRPLEREASLLLRLRSPEIQEFLRRVLANPTVRSQTDYLERVPFERLYRVSATPAGESGLIVLVFQDRSELRRIDRMRADFVANASHELRTPLASVAGFIDTLRGPAKDDAAARDNFLQIMQDQTARMARLIDDLLSLSRLETKGLIDPAQIVDLTQIVASVLDSLAPLAVQSGVSLTRAFSLEHAPVAGSRDELVQVFENLLENACKYAQSGRAVVVSINEGDSGAAREFRVTVKDFGPGIAEEHIPRLTERFYRVEVDPSRIQKGTGLGLAIVKHILTRHNGYLSIESSPGKGSAFTVHLPAA